MTHPSIERGAVVLVGGRSTRMGRDKASLPFDGSTLLDHVVATLAEVVTEIVVVARRDQPLPPLSPPPPGVEIHVAFDDVEDRGPVGGLAAGLAALSKPLAYLSSCDVPFLRPRFVRAMFDSLGDADVALPDVEGRLHPLAGVYRREPVLAAARALLAANRLRPIFLLETLPHVKVVESSLRLADPDLASLENLNSPDELARALARRATSATEPRAGAATVTRTFARVTIELYGIARRRAGRELLSVEGRTVADALRALERSAPSLRGEVVTDGALAPHWRLALDGATFLEDGATPLVDGARYVLLSSLAGG